VNHFKFQISNFRFFIRHGCKLALCSLFFVVNFSGAAADDFFSQGTAAYQAGQFPEAAAAFQKAAQAQSAAGTFINLGLAEWQRGHAGAAILAWEKARWIDPFDPRAEANLKFARAVAQVDEPQLKWFETAATWLPPNAWVWLAGASLWLAVGALVLPGIFRRRKAGWQQWLAALGFGFFLFSLAANFGVVSRTQIGFIVTRDTPLRLTPTREAEVMATLTAGEPAQKLRTRGNYFFIRTVNESGWIEQTAFGTVAQ
jgi:tetratricopeptide (TPR) repeat protein